MRTITTINPDRIEIDHANTPWVIRAILNLILAICGLIPILVTYFVLTKGDGPHFGIFISYLIFWGLGFYLLRIALWNTFGKEIITLEQDKISYLADYKYFKDGLKELKIKNLDIQIIYEDTMDIHVGRLRISNQESEIETVLKSSLTDLELIKEKIKTRYNKT